MAFDETFRLH